MNCAEANQLDLVDYLVSIASRQKKSGVMITGIVPLSEKKKKTPLK